MSRVPTIVVIMVSAALALAGCAAGGSTPAAPDPYGGPVVTVPLSYDAAQNQIPGVDVEIGGVTLHVKVDTGSTGLRVNVARVPMAAVHTIGPAAPYAFASGVRLQGTLAEATVGLGPLHSAVPTRFEIVQGSTCVAGHPDCHHPDGSFDGIIGLSPHPAPDLDNPLWSFGDVGRAYSVALGPNGGGTLRLGVPPAGFAIDPLTAPASGSPSHGVSGAPDWGGSTDLCAAATAFGPTPICGPTVFDTGSPPLADLHGPAGTARRLPPGSPVTLSTPDRQWSLGYTTAAGRTAILSGRSGGGRPAANLVGRPVFTRAEIRFDLEAGTFGIRST